MSAAFQDVSEKECLLNSDEEDLEDKSHFIEDCPQPHISARVSIQGRFSDTFQALIDSGSEINVMSQEIAKDFEKHSVDIEEAGDKPRVLVTANGSETQVKRKILVDLRLGRFDVGRFWFYIIKSCPETLVIGTKLWEH